MAKTFSTKRRHLGQLVYLHTVELSPDSGNDSLVSQKDAWGNLPISMYHNYFHILDMTTEFKWEVGYEVFSILSVKGYYCPISMWIWWKETVAQGSCWLLCQLHFIPYTKHRYLWWRHTVIHVHARARTHTHTYTHTHKKYTHMYTHLNTHCRQEPCCWVERCQPSKS